LGNLEESLSTGDFERWMKGALGTEHLSLKRLHGGGLGREALSLRTLEDMLSLRMWASLSIGALFHLRGTWYMCGGGSYIGKLW